MLRFMSAVFAATPAAALLGASLGGGAPAGAQDSCGGALSAVCAERLGAGAITLDDTFCQRQWAAYRACIKRLAEGAAGAPQRSGGAAACSEARAQSLWADAKDANDCIAYESFLSACPETPEARFATGRMRRLNCAGVAASSTPAASQPTPSSAAPASTAPASTAPASTAPAAPAPSARQADRISAATTLGALFADISRGAIGPRAQIGPLRQGRASGTLGALTLKGLTAISQEQALAKGRVDGRSLTYRLYGPWLLERYLGETYATKDSAAFFRAIDGLIEKSGDPLEIRSNYRKINGTVAATSAQRGLLFLNTALKGDWLIAAEIDAAGAVGRIFDLSSAIAHTKGVGNIISIPAAQQIGADLFFCISNESFSKGLSDPENKVQSGVMFKYDMKREAFAWVSANRVCNAEFSVRGDVIISAYGGSSRPDYIYRLDAASGAPLARAQIGTGVENLTRIGDDRYILRRYYEIYERFELSAP